MPVPPSPSRATGGRVRKPLPSGELLRLGPFDIPQVGPRHVRVFLPPGYHGSSLHHPLLLMWDGQNVFDDGPSFAGGWHLHDAITKRARRRKQVPIVAALEHGGELRIRELSPFDTPHGGALLEPLLEWVGGSLMPALQRQFRILHGPEHTAVGGSSMGGLAALYAHLRHPEIFGKSWVMSPSLFMGRGRIFEMAAQTSKPWFTKVYLDAGGQEAGGRLLRLAEKMANQLRSQGWLDYELMWRPVKTGQHNEKHWCRRSPKALKFLFG